MLKNYIFILYQHSGQITPEHLFEAPLALHSNGSLPTNIRQGNKALPEKNTLAYLLLGLSVTKKNVLYH